MEVKEIIQIMNSNIDSVLMHLLPNGKKSGHEYRVGSLSGESGKSLGIVTAGAKTGLWKDFATDESGDLLDLWKEVRGISIKDAIKEVKSFLNIVDEYNNTYTPKKEYTRPPRVQTELPDKARVYLKSRGLTDADIDIYGVKFKDNKIVFPYYKNGELVNNKYYWFDKETKKKQLRTEKNAEPCLFGWQAVSDDSRELVICEGEIDAMTMYGYGFDAVSVPYGVNNLDWIGADWEELDRFDTLYICMDMDEPGREATKKIAERLGYHRCRIVSLPYKDVNECKKNGIDEEQIEHFLKESKYLNPTNLKDISEFKDELINEFHSQSTQEYFSPQFHNKFQNVRFCLGELTIFAGINGHGKTTFLLQLGLDGISQNRKFFIASLEQKPKKYLKKTMRQATLNVFPEVRQIESAIDWLSGKFFVYNKIGMADNEDMIKTIIYAHKRYGVNYFIIDSLVKCGFAEDDYAGQKLFTEKLTDLCIDYNIHIFLVAHSKKKKNERSEMNKMDVKGTGAITDLASNVLILVRNKAKERSVEKGETKMVNEADASLLIEKQREYGWEGVLNFLYNRNYEMYYERDVINYMEGV